MEFKNACSEEAARDMALSVKKMLGSHFTRCAFTGTRYYTHWVDGADTDLLVLVDDLADACKVLLEEHAFTPCGPIAYASSKYEFCAVRRGDLNVILVYDLKVFDAGVLAAAQCRALEDCGVSLTKFTRRVIHRLARGEDTRHLAVPFTRSAPLLDL